MRDLFSSIVSKLYFPDKKFFRHLKNMLGFSPRNLEYYKRAFIHKSASMMSNDGIMINNERLEYLGDSILNSIIADLLYHKFPHENEGYLTKLRSEMVNSNKLDEWSHSLGIDKLLVSQMRKNDNKKYLYGDALEALIGAIYIDRGYKQARKFVQKQIINKFVDIEHLQYVDSNFKSKLIEWAQKNKKKITFSVGDDKEIEDKTLTFVAKVKIGRKILGTGIGSSKKEAEQKASEQALIKISQI